MNADARAGGLRGVLLDAWGSTRGLRGAAERIGLPAWFIAIDLLWIAKPDAFAIDARHYQRAAAAWLAGGDPWAVVEGIGGTYAAGPHTLLFYAPTSLVPLEASTAFWMALGLASSVWLVRRLSLPIWWLLFPPLTHAIWNGNPQTIALALLIHGSTVGAIAAVAIKLYAALALFFRPRALLLAGVALLITLPILPWGLYLTNGLGVQEHLATAWNGSAWRLPILLLPTLLALWVLRRQGAEWFAVPAVWPGTQFYYVGMAMPAVAKRPVVAATFALPMPLLVPLAVMALALLEIRRDPAVLRPSLALPRMSRPGSPAIR